MPRGQYKRQHSNKDIAKPPVQQRLVPGARVTEITYERVFPVPAQKFGVERFTLTASVDDDFPVSDVFARLRKLAYRNSMQYREDLKQARIVLAQHDDDETAVTAKQVSWAHAILDLEDIR